MFREDYNKANDNIKVDEALLEKTLDMAFLAKPKKKYYYRHISSIAAALIIVIGAGVAYPNLVQPTVTESTLIDSELPEATAFLPVGEKITAKEIITDNSESSASKKVVTETKKTNNSHKTDSVASSEVSTSAQSVPTQSAQSEAVMSEQTVNSAAMARIMPEPQATSNAQENVAAYNKEDAETSDASEVSYNSEDDSGFALQSCSELDETKVYIYQNPQGKTFTVTVEPYVEEEADNTEKNKIVIDDHVYTLSSDNMTDEELASAFESIEF